MVGAPKMWEPGECWGSRYGFLLGLMQAQTVQGSVAVTGQSFACQTPQLGLVGTPADTPSLSLERFLLRLLGFPTS